MDIELETSAQAFDIDLTVTFKVSDYAKEVKYNIKAGASPRRERVPVEKYPEEIIMFAKASVAGHDASKAIKIEPGRRLEKLVANYKVAELYGGLTVQYDY